jgi:hypothetical protein
MNLAYIGMHHHVNEINLLRTVVNYMHLFTTLNTYVH